MDKRFLQTEAEDANNNSGEEIIASENDDDRQFINDGSESYSDIGSDNEQSLKVRNTDEEDEEQHDSKEKPTKRRNKRKKKKRLKRKKRIVREEEEEESILSLSDSESEPQPQPKRHRRHKARQTFNYLNDGREERNLIRTEFPSPSPSRDDALSERKLSNGYDYYDYEFYRQAVGSPMTSNLSQEVLHHIIHGLNETCSEILESIASKTVTMQKLEEFMGTTFDSKTTTASIIMRDISCHVSAVLSLFSSYLRFPVCGQHTQNGYCDHQHCPHCPDCKDIPGISTRVCQTITAIQEELFGWLRANQYLGDQSTSENYEDVCVALSLNMESHKFNTTQRLILTILKAIKDMGLRRYQEQAYKEVKILILQDMDGNESTIRKSEYDDNQEKYTTHEIKGCYSTHSWEPEGTDLKNLVHRLCDRTVSFNSFMDITKTGGNVTAIAAYLESCYDPDFPQLYPNRHIRSFPNGILDVESDKLYLYGCGPSIPSNLVCIRHYEYPFPNYRFHVKSWKEIASPSFDKILRDQGLGTEIRFIFYAFLGRLLFKLTDRDNWQVIFFILGVAQSGKSTIGNIAKQLYKPEDVATLSSNIEGKFGLDAIVDKLLFICFEVTKSWSLPKADFQSIIVGESVSIAGKHKKARTVEFTVPGLLLGNELGGWRDTAGCMARRLLVGDFDKKIIVADTTLNQKLQKEMGSFIYKAYMSYNLLVHKAGEKDIWRTLPRYFTTIQETIAVATNPTKQFLTDEDQVILHPSLECPRSALEASLRTYTQQHRFSVERKELTGVLAEYKIRTEHKTATWNGQRHTCAFLIGIGIKNSDNVIEYEERQLEVEQKTATSERKTQGNEKWNAMEEEKETEYDLHISSLTALMTAKFQNNLQPCLNASGTVQLVSAGLVESS